MPETKTISPLTVAEQFDVIAEDVKWFIPRLLKRNGDGQLSRMATVQGLAELEREDTHADIHYCDDAGRRWLAEYLGKYDTARMDQAAVEEGIRQSLARMDPLHAARIIDGAIPPYETEQRGGKVEDKLNQAIADREEKQREEAAKRLSRKDGGDEWLGAPETDDVRSLQFSEDVTRQSARQLMDRVDRDLGYSDAEAERIARRVHRRDKSQV